MHESYLNQAVVENRGKARKRWSHKRQTCSRKTESKEPVLAEKPDDGEVHMLPTASTMAKVLTSPDTGQHSWAWPRPATRHPFKVASCHQPGLRSGPPWDKPVMHQPNPHSQELTRTLAPDRNSETTRERQRVTSPSVTPGYPAVCPQPCQKPSNSTMGTNSGSFPT